ncbi:MAG TPA: signal peptidase I [Allocoleopsis sp.]
MVSKEPWLAVNLSMFFPGIGQLYAGEQFRGLGLIGGELLLSAIAIWSIFSPTGNTVTGLMCLFLVAIIYIFSLFDAYSCVNQQLNVQSAEKIPRTKKDPWFALFLSRILPGLGQLYTEKAILGAVFLSLIIIISGLAKFFSNLVIFIPLISAVACYHAFVSFPRQRGRSQSLITLLTLLILTFGLVVTYLPQWIQQEVELFEIPSKSMLPTLQVGDRIFVKKSSSYSPQKGDVIVFKAPESAKTLEAEADQTNSKEEQFFVKRAIGQPGQIVRVDNGLVYINDQPLQETYIAQPPAYQWGPEQVPAQSYFVMGDNRNNSFDSHIWGFLQQHYIVGRAYKVFWPPGRIQSLLDGN